MKDLSLSDDHVSAYLAEALEGSGAVTIQVVTEQLETRDASGGPLSSLTIITVAELTVQRRKAGRGFFYLDVEGKRVTDADVLGRIRSLAIPPAYVDVRIAVDPNAHIQAVGRDEDGRLQYRYHPGWITVREDRKATHLSRLLAALPRIRTTVQKDLRTAKLSQTKALACAVALIDACFLRVGHESYAQMKSGRGTATLLKRDVEIKGSRIGLNFHGKGGKQIILSIADAGLARALKRIMTLRGRRLLQFKGADGKIRPITAADINAYLNRIAGSEISAKDLRMLGANALAIEAFAALVPQGSDAKRRRQIGEVFRGVADRLANTPAVVRKSYVHGRVVDAFSSGALHSAYRAARSARMKHRAENALQRLFNPKATVSGVDA